jgi:hypothetical protein
LILRRYAIKIVVLNSVEQKLDCTLLLSICLGVRPTLSLSDISDPQSRSTKA